MRATVIIVLRKIQRPLLRLDVISPSVPFVARHFESPFQSVLITYRQAGPTRVWTKSFDIKALHKCEPVPRESGK